LGKRFTCILNNRLTHWASKYNVYIATQAGFRTNMGTVDNIFVLQQQQQQHLLDDKHYICV